MSMNAQSLPSNQLTITPSQSLEPAYEQTYEPNARIVSETIEPGEGTFPQKINETKLENPKIPTANLGKAASSNKGSIGLLLLFIIALIILTVQKVPGQNQSRLGLVIDAIFGKAVIKQ